MTRINATATAAHIGRAIQRRRAEMINQDDQEAIDRVQRQDAIARLVAAKATAKSCADELRKLVGPLRDWRSTRPNLPAVAWEAQQAAFNLVFAIDEIARQMHRDPEQAD